MIEAHPSDSQTRLSISRFGQWRGLDACRLLASASPRLSLLRRCGSDWRTLHAIECFIRRRQEFLNGLPVFRENSTADTDGDGWTFAIGGDTFADSCRNLLGLRSTRLGKHHSKLVAPVSRCCVDLPAIGSLTIAY